MIDLLGYGAFFLSMALTYAIICLGLNVQWGQTGLFNVGVAGFVAIGAYASALLTTPDAPDRLGGFVLRDVPPGEYTLAFATLDHFPLRTVVVVRADQTHSVMLRPRRRGGP